MKTYTLAGVLLCAFLLQACVKEPAPRYNALATCKESIDIDPWNNTSFTFSDKIEVAYDRTLLSVRSPYPIQRWSTYTPADCGNDIAFAQTGQVWNYYFLELLFEDAYYECNREQRGPDGFWVDVVLDCSTTPLPFQDGDVEARQQLLEWGGWKSYIDSVGSYLDGSTINGEYINMEGIPALGVISADRFCTPQGMYFDFVPHSNEPESMKAQNVMNNCLKDPFEAEVTGCGFEFHHDTDREIIHQKIVLASGTEFAYLMPDEWTPSGIEVQIPKPILAAYEETGFLFFALGHE